LIHDDIMDAGQMRRGQPCVHRVFGSRIAITAGDALIFEAYRQILRLARDHPAPVVERVLQVFTACAARTCRGQAHDVVFSVESATLRHYLAMIRAKTGSMIEAPLESVAVLAGASDVARQRLRQYGRCVGIAFQIFDDALDYLGSEDHARKTLGNDLRAGGASAMFIVCRDRCSASERDALTDAMRRIRVSTDREPITLVLALLRKHGAVAFTQRLCASYVDRAVRALRGAGLGAARTELETIATTIALWDTEPSISQ
jgi:geranylgeranyl diphosphate synthase type I